MTQETDEELYRERPSRHNSRRKLKDEGGYKPITAQPVGSCIQTFHEGEPASYYRKMPTCPD